MTDPRMSASNKPVDPRFDMITRFILNLMYGDNAMSPYECAEQIIRALDEYEARKK